MDKISNECERYRYVTQQFCRLQRAYFFEDVFSILDLWARSA